MTVVEPGVLEGLELDELLTGFGGPDSPGCLVGVIRAGELREVACYGLAHLEHAVPITPTTVFDIGSTSKQFTAAAVHLAAEAGLLSLDDDVRGFLPVLPATPFSGITVRHLLHHTSGITDYLALLLLSGRTLDNDYAVDEIVALIAQQQGLDFAPGSMFSYSNSGYLLLGEVVRAASGLTLRAFARERLFGPLGMTSTFFRDDHSEVIPGRASAYGPRGDGYACDVPLLDVVGDGAVHTTAADLARWDAEFYRPGSVATRLLEPGRLDDGTATGYASGLFVDEREGHRRIHHAGGWGGYRAQLLRYPDEQLSVVVLANFSHAPVTRLAELFAGRALGLDDLVATPPPSPDTSAPDTSPPPPGSVNREHAGRYHSTELGCDVLVEADDSGLRMRIGWTSWQSLTPADGGAYQCELGPLVTFTTEGLEIAGPPTRTQRYVRCA
jgi:CubicO group peptidase (beta-lactamase class C family)